MTTIARRITGGSTRTSTCTWRQPSTNEEPSSAWRALPPLPRATRNSWVG